MHSFRRVAVSVPLALTMALSLSACGESGDEPTPEPSASAAAETTEELRVLDDLGEIKVSGEFEAEPTVEMPEPFVVEETISEAIISGDGATVPSTSAPVKVHYAGYNARTGEQFDSSWGRGEPVVFSLDQLVPGFGKGVVDKNVGSRVVVAMTSADGYGPGGQPAAGIEGGDTLVFVIDILDTQLAGPAGTDVDLPAEAPNVSDGDVPEISIGNANPPAETKVYDIIAGNGEPLGVGDQVWTNARCLTWDGKEFYNDYEGSPAVDSAQSGVHQALWASLEGVEVGSRVLVTMPGDDAFPNGNRNPEIEAGTAAACVVDVLYKQSAQ